MVWKPEDALEKQREDFVKEALGKEKPFRQLCREYGISRKTGYKWRKRALEEGVTALRDRQRGPQEGSGQRIEPSWKQRIVELKKKAHLGSEKAFCSPESIVSGPKDPFASDYRPNPGAMWLSAESNSATKQAWSSAAQAETFRTSLVQRCMDSGF
jgi:transposase-like protein